LVGAKRGNRLLVRIAVCDVGLGNLRSVERALREVSRGRVDVEVTADPLHIGAADALVMPGQGGFGDCARALTTGIGDAVRDHIARERPYLGICLGLQMLFGRSDEAPGCRGLEIMGGAVVRLPGGVDPTTGGALKVPHVGWNAADPVEGQRGLLPADPAHFYFVHSFVVVPDDASVIAATTEYGSRFVSAVTRGNVFACQFHPEKSQRDGLALLERFLAS
jgi:glutamine amidotransferase